MPNDGIAAPEAAAPDQMNASAALTNLLFSTEQQAGLPEEKPIEGEVLDPEKPDETEFFEFAPETEGAEPRRVPVDDVISGYQETVTLRSENEKLRGEVAASAILPDQIEQIFAEKLAQSHAMQRAMAEYESYLRPQQPNQALIDPKHAGYDPVAYGEQMLQYEQTTNQLKAVQQQRQQLASEAQQEQLALHRSMLAKEQATLIQAWPEIRQPETYTKLEAVAAKYGITKQELSSTNKASHFLVLRGLMELEDMKAKGQAAVKAVSAKPKLVRGQTSQNPAARQGTSEAIARMHQTRDPADVSRALAGFFQ